MLGQSFPLTAISLNLTRRITFTGCQFFGVPPKKAMEVADDVAISAASVVATAAAIVTIDPAGGAMSAAYLLLESDDATKRTAAALRGKTTST